MDQKKWVRIVAWVIVATMVLGTLGMAVFI